MWYFQILGKLEQMNQFQSNVAAAAIENFQFDYNHFSWDQTNRKKVKSVNKVNT